MFSNMKRKFIIFVIAFVMLLVNNSIIVSAASTYDVDNDTSNSNYSNNSGRYTHYSGTWGSYLYSGYNGDARLRSSTTKGSYEWVWYGNHYGSKFKMEVWVYLANNNFTDTAAKYNIFQDSNMFTSAYSFYINQNIAPSGFTAKVKTKTTAITNGQLGLLQIPPHNGHPCPQLTLPTAKRVADFHRLVTAHFGQTQKGGL